MPSPAAPAAPTGPPSVGDRPAALTAAGGLQVEPPAQPSTEASALSDPNKMRNFGIAMTALAGLAATPAVFQTFVSGYWGYSVFFVPMALMMAIGVSVAMRSSMAKVQLVAGIVGVVAVLGLAGLGITPSGVLTLALTVAYAALLAVAFRADTARTPRSLAKTGEARQQGLAAVGYDETMRADLERSTYRVQLPGMENSSLTYQQLCSMAAAGQLNSLTVVQRLETGVSVQLAALPGVYSRRNKTTALLLSFFVGGLGVDRFYLGYVGLGILKLLTLGLLGIWTLIDFILIAMGKMKDKDGLPLA
jgi:hypothetical protein